RIVGHGGGNKGIAAHVACVPEQALTVAGLTNLAGAPVQRLTFALLNAALGLPTDTALPEQPEQPLTPAKLAEYAGTYKRTTRPTRFFLEDGRLFMAAEPKPVLLTPIGGARFRRAGRDTLLFLRNAEE